jgi:hypothetical protein
VPSELHSDIDGAVGINGEFLEGTSARGDELARRRFTTHRSSKGCRLGDLAGPGPVGAASGTRKSGQRSNHGQPGKHCMFSEHGGS